MGINLTLGTFRSMNPDQSLVNDLYKRNNELSIQVDLLTQENIQLKLGNIEANGLADMYKQLWQGAMNGK